MLVLVQIRNSLMKFTVPSHEAPEDEDASLIVMRLNLLSEGDIRILCIGGICQGLWETTICGNMLRDAKSPPPSTPGTYECLI